MSKIYSEEEKQAYLGSFKVSGKSKTAYARENNIPEATFRAWIKDEYCQLFGAIDINPIVTQTQNSKKENKQSTIFSCNNIRIELKEGFDKQFFKRIVEVLINDN